VLGDCSPWQPVQLGGAEDGLARCAAGFTGR
jgi:hypothetical protein